MSVGPLAALVVVCTLLGLCTSTRAGVIKGLLKLESGAAVAKSAVTFTYGKRDIKATTDKNGNFTIYIPGARTCYVTVAYKGEKITGRVASRQQTVKYTLEIAECKSKRDPNCKWRLRVKQ